MTISNHAQTHSNGTQKNGEKAKGREGASNGEAAKPESAKVAAKAEGPSSETHPKNGAPKGVKKENGESKAAKRHSKSEPDKPTGSPGVQHVLGYRGHCEDEDHFPTTSLMLRDLDAMKRWVGKMANTVPHLNCVWKAEELYITDDGRLLSRTGEMDQEHPGTGMVEWSKELPFDLGPLSDLISPEGSRPGARERALRSGRLRPSDDPQREETLLIHISDDLHDELWSAVIQRRPHRPPRLGRWEKTDLKTDHMTGRFIEPLRAALEQARASNN
jgi:hypothetical protein